MREQEIEELRARRRQLLQMRQEEQQLMERGEGDEFNLFVLNEEIAGVNDQLRLIDPRLRRKPRFGGISTCGDSVDAKSATTNVNSDRRAFADWLISDREDNHDALVTMAQTVSEADRYLKPRQLEAFELWRGGMSITDIAERMEINKSTASRLIAAAKAAIRRELEARQLPQLGDKVLIDVSDVTTASAVLACLTGKQAVFLYLYYGEALSLRDIGQLLEVDYTAVSKAITRGLANVSEALHYKAAELENLEALGDVAYELFREDFAPPPDIEARAIKTTDWGRRALGKAPREKRVKPAPRQVTVSARRDPARAERGAGKLLKELLTTAGLTRLRRWLEALFGRCAQLARDARRKKERTRSYVLR